MMPLLYPERHRPGHMPQCHLGYQGLVARMIKKEAAVADELIKVHKLPPRAMRRRLWKVMPDTPWKEVQWMMRRSM